MSGRRDYLDWKNSSTRSKRESELMQLYAESVQSWQDHLRGGMRFGQSMRTFR